MMIIEERPQRPIAGGVPQPVVTSSSEGKQQKNDGFGEMGMNVETMHSFW